jgi:hypothetical protein
MRIMKLLVVFGLSYLGYRLYRDIEERGGMEGSGGRRRPLRRALNEESGRMQTLTGPDHRGTTVSVSDPSGSASKKTVGRGVL